jgi:hypothetical protein
MINNVFYKPQKKKSSQSYLENKGPREWVPVFLPNNQKTPFPERHKQWQKRGGASSNWKTVLTGT